MPREIEPERSLSSPEEMAMSQHGPVRDAVLSRESNSSKYTHIKRKGSEWEILVNLEKGVEYTIKPKKYEGYLSKRRKWPMKGWQKRYFVLEQGILTYAKNCSDIARGRTLGKINIGIAVISANYQEMRIDIDADESVHHVKLDNMEHFALLLEQLQQHRLFLQHLSNTSQTPLSPLDEVSISPTIPNFAPRSSLTRGLSLRSARSNIIAEFSQLDENLVQQMDHLQAQFGNLLDIIHKLEPDVEHTSEPAAQKKKLFHLRKKKSGGNSSSKPSSAGSDRSSPILLADTDSNSTSTLLTMSSLSGSNPSLTGQVRFGEQSGTRPASLPADGLNRPIKQTLHPSSQDGATTKDDVAALASEMQADLSSTYRRYIRERDHLKVMLENENKSSTLQPSVSIAASLRQSLNAALRQNTDLRTRLARIHAESDIGDLPATPAPDSSAASLPRGMDHSLSYSSSCISEFFDAREYADSGEDTDDEDSESGSAVDSSPETEEDDMFSEATATLNGTVSTPVSESNTMTAMTGRRRALPVPKTETEGVNLWNLLCKNIGKDLSKISMPVTLNEPISMLQRLCEELEYSDLVDKAKMGETPLERMQWVAAFVVSAYGSLNTRASHKPFNPLLGETYENVRDDKGFKFIAEQVSHHPPISAAHAEGQGWVWSQQLRIRSKFWGKSMEFQPEGLVELELEQAGSMERYTWNKVTSCIHNLLGAERWVDLYGECVVSCQQTGLTARIQFVKASYWSNKRHEVFGTITDSQGNVMQNLFGKWSEALYVGKAPSTRCIWRPGTLPDDAELYYGFSRFAIELNEMVGNETSRLPPTDTRWRPDQRALEEGRIAEAENIKLGIEQMQRDRRRQRDSGQLEEFKSMWFKFIEAEEEDGENEGKWKFGHEYWTVRDGSGFQNKTFDSLW